MTPRALEYGCARTERQTGWNAGVFWVSGREQLSAACSSDGGVLYPS
ncbi:MAG TPA: hypothetical protein VER11_32455 [Polyangiaceae bacterium]|nr:hypothetical protein [Polyangiaceae bacterium]